MINNKKTSLRLLLPLAILLILIGFLFSFYQLLNLEKRKDTVQKSIDSLTIVKKKLELENHSLENIIKQSDDEKMKLKAKSLATIKLDTTITLSSKKKVNNYELALKNETLGFQFLIDKNVNSAISSFKKSEESYNAFHQVYEISRFLEKNKTQLQSAQSLFWKKAYLKIATEYSWKMDNKIKQKLIEASSK